MPHAPTRWKKASKAAASSTTQDKPAQVDKGPGAWMSFHKQVYMTASTEVIGWY